MNFPFQYHISSNPKDHFTRYINNRFYFNSAILLGSLNKLGCQI